MNLNRNERRLLEKQNAKQPLVLVQIPRREWPDHGDRALIEVWRSRDFLVQIYAEPNGYERMSICSTLLVGESWADGLSWDQLMMIKRQAGRGSCDALEVYPADQDIVNVANMRHLWLPLVPVEFAWRKSE